MPKYTYLYTTLYGTVVCRPQDLHRCTTVHGRVQAGYRLQLYSCTVGNLINSLYVEAAERAGTGLRARGSTAPQPHARRVPVRLLYTGCSRKAAYFVLMCTNKWNNHIEIVQL